MFGYNIKSKLTKLCKNQKNQDELISLFIDFTTQLLHPKSPDQYRNLIINFEEFNVEDLWFALYHSKSNSSSAVASSSSTSPPSSTVSSPRSGYSPIQTHPNPSQHHHPHNHQNRNHHDQTTIDNMKKALEMIKLMNIVLRRVYALKNESYDLYKSDHLLLLTELWNNLKPDRPRVTINPETHQSEIDTNIISPDWIEIGFQGNDPTTDFRGMGILGLTQLYYFSRNRNQAARMILQMFTQDKQKYYPFAIIGINITRFLLELIAEFRIHKLLIENLGHVFAAELTSYTILPSNDPICIEFGMNLINDIYCIIFEEFYLQWVIVNPVNIMSFNTIFDQVKQSIRNKYESLLDAR